MHYISSIDLNNEELIRKLDSKLDSVSKSRSVLRPSFELEDLECAWFGKTLVLEVLLLQLEMLFT